MIRSTPPNVLLVHPRFSRNSFWNYHETCAVAGARYSAAPLGLITVAGLLPADWPVRLVDRNIEGLAASDLDWADVVMIGCMLPQQRDAKEVIALAHARGTPVVIGGPDVTSSPSVYPEADFRVMGEAEDILAGFIDAWRRGDTGGEFTAPTFPDLRRSPLPRFDLLKLQHYLHVGVQFSRGCPFRCEFCNVIELNGRVPRFKSTAQVIAELDALHALGYRGHVDFVDDNLIGNPKAARPLLQALGDWSEAHRHPFEFSTEASLNLADNDELLALMQRAGFFAVFVGIETPDEAVLVSAGKLQNARRDIAASVRRIYQAGMFVNAGFILGFDAESDAAAGSMAECIEAAAIPMCMVGLLYALPSTALSRRLAAEGRLHAGSDRLGGDADADQCTSGLNFDTLRPRAEILADYRAVLARINAPAAFFGRVRRLNRALDLSQQKIRRPLRQTWQDLQVLLRIAWELGVRERGARRQFWRTLADSLRHDPRTFRHAVSFAALYLHVKTFSRFMDARLAAQVSGLAAAPPTLRQARAARA
ncbi:MAG: B12-binding domain-containing radical SAM protein [Candidatus Krumholzibacteriia bacterium]